MQNPPPPPSMGPSPLPPAGVLAPARDNLASGGLRIVGGLIDFVLLLVVFSILEAVTNRGHALSGVVQLAVALGYFGYFWSSRGQSIGMMVFGFRVRDRATGRYPSVGKAVLRGLAWWLEVVFTVCLVGALGWLWMLWDPQKQAIHDKVVGTIVTSS